jgi:hypothetical protein
MDSLNLSTFLKPATVLPIKRDLGQVKMTRVLTAAQMSRYFKTTACGILFREHMHSSEIIGSGTTKSSRAPFQAGK